MSEDVEALATHLCPPHHRIGIVSMIVGQPARYGATKPCELHWSLARQVGTSDWLAAREAAARAEGAAEALREAADEVGPALQNEVSGHTSTYSVRRWLRDRAARIEESR